MSAKFLKLSPAKKSKHEPALKNVAPLKIVPFSELLQEINVVIPEITNMPSPVSRLFRKMYKLF
jgi:hypothetical protein